MSDEQEAYDYCMHHPLARPKTYPVASIAFFLLGEAGLQGAANFLSQTLTENTVWKPIPFLCYCLLSTLLLLLAGRWLAIYAIRSYQRYAPEAMRRKCTCKPNCSEYAIEAFRKYGLFVGAYKTYRRLAHTCRSGHYTVDYP